MKSKSSELLNKSISAMIAAIEIYNKPDFPYRGETFSILAINSWELLLKAKYLKDNKNKMSSLYVMEDVKNKDGSKSKKKRVKLTRSGNPFTHAIDFIAKKLIEKGELDPIVFDNIMALIELRDSAIHFYNYSLKFNVRIQEIGTASLKNYVCLYKKWFNKDLSEYNFYLMPLSFVQTHKESDVLMLNNEEKNFFKFVDELEDKASSNEDYSIALNIDVKFSKSTSKDTIKVALSQAPDAIKVTLTEEQLKAKYPFDYKELTEKCKKRYSDFSANLDYHKYRHMYENDDKCAYIRYLDPNKKNSNNKKFYSEVMLNRLDNHYTKK